MSIYVVPSFYPDGPENAPADCGRDDMPTAFIVYDDADESDVRIVKIFDNRNDADKFVAAYEEPEGQDRESYSDDQDRESYSTDKPEDVK